MILLLFSRRRRKVKQTNTSLTLPSKRPKSLGQASTVGKTWGPESVRITKPSWSRTVRQPRPLLPTRKAPLEERTRSPEAINRAELKGRTDSDPLDIVRLSVQPNFSEDLLQRGQLRSQRNFECSEARDVASRDSLPGTRLPRPRAPRSARRSNTGTSGSRHPAARTGVADGLRLPQGASPAMDPSTSANPSRRKVKAKLSFGSTSSGNSSMPCHLQASVKDLIALLETVLKGEGEEHQSDLAINETDETGPTKASTIGAKYEAESARSTRAFLVEHYEVAATERSLERHLVEAVSMLR
ncbi:hypothetical protein HPB50_019190 [Hyalomma asiaticum]|uniref:Uncharacterized protein n=1 Tax=Hyalomma asiaticum TaxID=266040 RepID=A0ACB7RRU0_HYAAI|nr:hypothetical protein HPB50_019190 [Hyalomma asiaticum]